MNLIRQNRGALVVLATLIAAALLLLATGLATWNINL